MTMVRCVTNRGLREANLIMLPMVIVIMIYVMETDKLIGAIMLLVIVGIRKGCGVPVNHPNGSIYCRIAKLLRALDLQRQL